MEQQSTAPVQKPLVVICDQARKDLINLVNHYLRNEQLPCFILEPYVKEIYTELKLNAEHELEQGYNLMKQEQTIQKDEK